MNRQFFVLMHRYVGLVTAIFLVIVGLTGALISFFTEIDNYLNRDLVYVAKPANNAQLVTPYNLRDKVLAIYPDTKITYIDLKQAENRAATFYLEPDINPKTNKPTTLKYSEIYVNPYTAQVIGGRNSGDLFAGWHNIMPFIYELHYSLALGDIGAYILGFVALFWTIDCFVGAYLTFPTKQRKSADNQLADSPNRNKPINHTKQWFSRWQKAWKIRWKGGVYKLNFDFHRASGLWLWAMVFIFAWSSVGFNLSEVYSPVTKFIFAQKNTEDNEIKLAKPLENPRLNFVQASEVGKKLMLEQARLKNFKVLTEQAISYNAVLGTYRYRVKSSRDVSEERGSTSVFFNATTGDFIKLDLPSGEHAGDTVTTWLFVLHMAKIWGLPMQMFVCLMGLVIVGLSITGIYIWLKKRQSRRVYKKILPNQQNTLNHIQQSM